jgi:hypothetical protein
VELDVAGTHVVVVVDGAAHHLEALLVGEEGLTFLERVLRGDYVPDLVEVAVCQHGTADDEVPHVDGVERAEEETYVTHEIKLRIEN